ncbi:MAG: DUF2330 domain-containing protein [Actinomycetota bacterium]
MRARTRTTTRPARSARRSLFGAAVLVAGFLTVGAGTAVACGGFFCQTSPVDQTGERNVFTVNDDGTVTSLVEILYQGSAEDFSWILPIPEAIAADDLAVPEGGQAVFDELHELTDVQIIPPAENPECAIELRAQALDSADDDMADDGGVDIFASGEVGPFGFDVIGSEDPSALIQWLRDNDYRVEQQMEPLINLYVDEQFAFIAMRLLDGEDADSIQPIEITYPGTQPMIPLRLTAVAAQPDMPIWTWIFGDRQAVPENTAHIEIETAELTFNTFGGNDYRRLVADRSDANEGRAFITEFAGPAATLTFEHDYLQQRSQRYLTRLFAIISPEEMTVDPVFAFEDRPDVSNIRDASQLVGLYDCQRAIQFGAGVGVDLGDDDMAMADELADTSDALNPRTGDGATFAEPVAAVIDLPAAELDELLAAVDGAEDDGSGATTGLLVLAAVVVAVGGGAVALRPRR